MEVEQVKLYAAKDGMVLAQDVVNPENKKTILRTDTILTSELISFLESRNVTNVVVHKREPVPQIKKAEKRARKSAIRDILEGSVDEKLLEEIKKEVPSKEDFEEEEKEKEEKSTKETAEVINKEALNLSREILENVFEKSAIDIEKTKNAVKELIDSIILDREVINNLFLIKSEGNYLFSHTVKVASLSVLLAVSMEMSVDALQQIGMGAMLHDIGMTKIPKEIVNKTGKLTTQEYEEVKKHTAYGKYMMRVSRRVSGTVLDIIYSHHERENGSGYPEGINGLKMSLPVKIVAVADIYEALTSMRPYRRNLSQYEAMMMILGQSGKLLNSKVVNALLLNLSIYPVGSYVELNTNEIALVIGTNKNSPIRPKVKVVYDASARKIVDGRVYDLIKEKGVFVKKMWDDTGFEVKAE